MIRGVKKILVISPHPDDETLGAGGTIKRFSEMGKEIYILTISGHMPPLYSKESYEVTKKESSEVFKLLGVSKYEYLDIPATKVNEMPRADINNKIFNFIKKIKPEMVFIPFPDRHIDHRVIFDASVVACRPNRSDAPKILLAYETLSETHWNVPGIEPSFNPNFFINIDNFLDFKLKAINLYKSQINSLTQSRSAEACEALARFRGSQNGCKYAESFQVIRIVY